MSEKPIRIVVINGSVRPNNYTSMASALVVDELRKDPEADVQVINPAELDLPFPGLAGRSDGPHKLQEAVKQAAGIVLATPEYHGSFSSVMKLVIENLGFPSLLEGKPIALLGVAAGSIGAIKSLEHLRGVASHVGAVVLPTPISVANVRSVFDASGKVTDPNVERMIRGVARNLMQYLRGNVCPRVTLERLMREGAVAVA
ncbi:MAG: NADPH-dependent FMN reductase [Terriglobales bacterium]